MFEKVLYINFGSNFETLELRNLKQESKTLIIDAEKVDILTIFESEKITLESIIVIMLYEP